MQTEFSVLAMLCEKLNAESKRTVVVGFVADFLRHLQVNEVEPATSMILGRPFPKSYQKKLEVSWGTLSGLIKRLIEEDWESFRNALRKTGDIGSATKIVFEARKILRQTALFEKPLTIIEVSDRLKAVADISGHSSREKKTRLLENLLSEAKPLEAKYLVNILVHEMRIGFQEGLMELAVSKAFGCPVNLVKRANMLTGDIGEVAAVAKVSGKQGLAKLEIQLFRPLKPMLAQTAGDVYEVFKRHEGVTAFEYKLDGVRIQIHKTEDTVKLYSRMLTNVTESFPEIASLIRDEVKTKEAILEGEIIAVGVMGNPLPFQHLMRRIQRVHNIDQMVKKIPVELHLFDFLYCNGESLINLHYVERRKRLARVSGSIPLTIQKISGDSSEAEDFLKEAIDKGHEGLLAKKLDSLYTPGIRWKQWLKIKEPLEPLDLVIVAAQYGYGRRHNWLSDYFLAALDSINGEFVTVGKTFKGLTDEEIIEMTLRLKQLIIEEKQGMVTVSPKIVVEVAYNEIQKSRKYKCGMTLRFARITRIRRDKSPEETDTIQRIREIYEKQFKKKSKTIAII